MRTEINEKFLAQCELTKEELKIARYFYNLSSAGKKTRAWAEKLSSNRFKNLLMSMLKKVRTYVQLRG